VVAEEEAMMLLAPDGGALIPRMFCGGRTMDDTKREAAQKVCDHCGGVTHGDEPDDEFHDNTCPHRCDAAVAAEREACAKIADEQRELWHSNERVSPDYAGGSAASFAIATAIRKRSEETPEHGGDVVDDAGPGGDRPSQPPPVRSRFLAENGVPPWPARQPDDSEPPSPTPPKTD
jgi:hypothetical protein